MAMTTTTTERYDSFVAVNTQLRDQQAGVEYRQREGVRVSYERFLLAVWLSVRWMNAKRTSLAQLSTPTPSCRLHMKRGSPGR